MKFRNVSWGLFFILSAILVILNQLGMLVGISLLNLVVILFLVPIFVSSIRYFNFWGILFPLAIVGILFAEPLGISSLTPWPILGVALFLSIGLSLIFPHRAHYSRFSHDYCGPCDGDSKEDSTHGFDNATIEEVEDEEITIDTRFCGSIKYINSSNLKEANVSCRYAGLKIYLDGANLKDQKAIMNLDVDFSGVEIFIPRDWKIVNQIRSTFGGVDEEGYMRSEKTENTLTLKGKIAFSGITLHYV